MNVELAQKILDHAEDHFESVQMSDWFTPRMWTPKRNKYAKKPWKCGTTACICGWAMYLSGRIKFDKYGDPILGAFGFEETGARLLGLSTRDALDIFYTMNADDALDKLARHIVEAS